jgi:hypothetical protein
MKKILKIKDFTDELIKRIDEAKGIDCCKTEIKNLALIAKKHIGDNEIEVDWKDKN